MPSTAYAFLAERNDRLIQALNRNKDVAQFIQAFLEHLIDRAEAKGVQPEDLTIDPPQIVQRGAQSYISARIR